MQMQWVNSLGFALGWKWLHSQLLSHFPHQRQRVECWVLTHVIDVIGCA
jgi:hypothetical protein